MLYHMYKTKNRPSMYQEWLNVLQTGLLSNEFTEDLNSDS